MARRDLDRRKKEKAQERKKGQNACMRRIQSLGNSVVVTRIKHAAMENLKTSSEDSESDSAKRRLKKTPLKKRPAAADPAVKIESSEEEPHERHSKMPRDCVWQTTEKGEWVFVPEKGRGKVAEPVGASSRSSKSSKGFEGSGEQAGYTDRDQQHRTSSEDEDDTRMSVTVSRRCGQSALVLHLRLLFKMILSGLIR